MGCGEQSVSLSDLPWLREPAGDTLASLGSDHPSEKEILVLLRKTHLPAERAGGEGKRQT